MNSKVIGVMLILGPILTMGTWMLYSVETSDMSIPERLSALIAEKDKAQIGASIRMLGLTSMFMGLYFLARSLKSDNSISNVCANIGGLLLLLCVPIWVLNQGADITAINHADKFGNAAGEAILAASLVGRNVFFLFVTGIFMLGISLTLLKRYKRIPGLYHVLGALFIITSVIGMTGLADAVAWLGMFGLTIVAGISTILKKENQN